MRRAGIAAAIVLLLAGSARAAEPTAKELAQARDLFSKAEQQEESGHFEEALTLLEQAIRIKTTPGLRFHIGYSKEKLGRYKEALADYEEAERLARAEKKDEVLAILKEQLPALKEKLPTLDFVGAEPPFSVAVDQEPAFPYAGVFAIDPGPHRIVLRAEGRQSFQKDISLRERERVHLEVQLPVLAPVAAPVHDEAPPPREPPSKPKTLAIATAVTAVVLVGAAVPLYLMAGSAQKDGEACKSDCDEFRSKVRVYDWTSASLLAAGVASGVVSIVLFTRSGKSAADEPTEVSKHTFDGARVGISPNGLFLSGSFQ